MQTVKMEALMGNPGWSTKWFQATSVLEKIGAMRHEMLTFFVSKMKPLLFKAAANNMIFFKQQRCVNSCKFLRTRK